MAGVCTGPGPCDTTPFGTGNNWVNKVGGLPLYIRAVAKAFRRQGLTESQAIERAVGVVRNWAQGKGTVSAATRARAVKALAEWEAKKTAAHTLTADPPQAVDLAWDESKHPRNRGRFAPKGSRTVGAQPKPKGSDLPPSLAAQVRDFQKRAGLPVTGTFDQATKARITALTGPKPAGSKTAKHAAALAKAAARKKAAAARKAARAQQKAQRAKVSAAKHQAALDRAARARTAAAVNKLTAAQRATYRQRQPQPPAGYTWTGKDHLRATGTTVQAQQVRKVVGLASPLTSADSGQHVTVSALVKHGEAMPPAPGTGRAGRFPIRNHDDLRKAIRAVGRAKGDHAQVRRFIIRRANAIGGAHLIPDNWAADGSLK